jgi:hypothetical protein
VADRHTPGNPGRPGVVNAVAWVVDRLAGDHLTPIRGRATPPAHRRAKRKRMLLVEVGEVGADARDGGLDVFGVADAEAGEEVQGLLPMLAGLVVLVEGVVSMG